MSEEKTGQVSLKVEDVMTTEVITINENASVKEAADIMDQNEKLLNCFQKREDYRHNHRKGPVETRNS